VPGCADSSVEEAIAGMGAMARHRGHARPKLFLFCSHAVAQEQFARLLQRTEFEVAICRGFCLPEDSSDASEAKRPCLAVVDASDVIATLEFVRTLRLEQPSMPVLVLLPQLDDSVASSLLRLGVKGLLAYHQAPRELCRAALQVSTDVYWVPRDLLTRFVESILPELSGCKSLGTLADISRREREVLDLLLDNLSNKEIASKLFVSERTIKFHVSNLLSKFGVQRRADLIVLWMQRTTAFPWLGHEMVRSLTTHIN
jgi:two-component system, NarL family, response regulator DevR